MAETTYIMEKNLTLSTEFSLYLMENPEFVQQIPPNARVVLLPADDPDLARINLEAAEQGQMLDDEPDRPVVYVEFERLQPRRSRLVAPHLIDSPEPML